MKKIIIYLSILLVLPIAGCKKFLEEEPLVLASIKTVDQLEALINNPVGTTPSFAYQTNLTAAYSTDDSDIPMEIYRNAGAAITLNTLYYYTFKVDEIANAATDALWNNEYSKIFTANIVLFYADKVTGNPATINKVKADAYLIRAYAYWELVNHYCLPYAPSNMASPGLPIKKTTSYEESLVRVSLRETYDFIESDLLEAQKLATNELNPLQKWRASKPAIDAFLSRYYLFIEDYDKSLQYANAALTNTDVKLVDYSKLAAGTSMVLPNPTETLRYTELNDWAAAKFLYWDELYFTRYTYNGQQWNCPSQSLMSLYDTTNDLRFTSLFIPNSNRRFLILSPSAYRYAFFRDGSYIPEGPSVPEVLLNKAEVLARKGDFAGAMASVNILRAKRMKTTANLSASNAADGLVKVLQERRREMPFTMRWFDIRRFSVNADASDDIIVTHRFFKVNDGSVDFNTIVDYSLPVKSSRYKVPINAAEIANSRGQIQQNTY